MKKYLALIISLTVFIVMLLGIKMTSFASPSQTVDIARTRLGTTDTYYEFDAKTKTLTISGSGAAPNLENRSTGTLHQPWFTWKVDGSIERIVVENGVTALGNNFFRGVDVADIELPSSIAKLGSYALAENASLKNINIENVVSISNHVFYACSGLERIFIPSDTSYIGINAFEGCSSLEQVEFEKMSMTVTISTSAFLKCPSLKSVTVPRYAKVGGYAFGFQKASAGAVYEDFVLNVYSDSPAYTFAKNTFIKYSLLTDMIIYEGDELACKYFCNETTDSNGNVRIDTNIDEKINYYFTPDADALYTFYSTNEGNIDIDCTLKNSKGEIIKVATDNIEYEDLNFTIEWELNAGETYCFTVESVKQVGDYTLHLLPVGMEGVRIDWDLTFPAGYFPQGEIDIPYLINGKSVDFLFSSGYVYHMPFEEGASYLSKELHYAGILNNKVSCGDNYDYITVGDERLEFCIHIEHSYIYETVEPTVKEQGYKLYTCTLCGDNYKTDFVERLGTDVHGQLKLLADTNGTVIENSFIAFAYIYDNNGELVGRTDKQGFFSVECAYEQLTFESPDGARRTIAVERSKSDLGEIAVIGCDFNCDGYVNAKDFAIFTKVFGKYDNDDYLFMGLDINENGEMDAGDWEYAKNFYTYGKLNESIYDN